MMHGHPFLDILAWLTTGLIVWSLVWKYIWKSADDTVNLHLGTLLLGTIFWPVVLLITAFGIAVVGVIFILEKPVKSYLNWLNNKPNEKKSKDINAC